MKYSCFNQESGLYRVFEDEARIPINGDLPVPALGPELNGIGVPSLDAARPLPAGARYLQDSWVPVGMVVSCGRPAGGLGSFTLPTGPAAWGIFLGAAAAGLLLVRAAMRRAA